jgi:hypothetical protein
MRGRDATAESGRGFLLIEPSDHSLELSDRVFALLNNDRDRGLKPSPSRLFEVLRADGVELDWKDLSDLGYLFDWQGIPTRSLVEFMSAVAGMSVGGSVFDPWANCGVLLAGVLGDHDSVVSAGIVVQPDHLPVAESLCPHCDFVQGMPLSHIRLLQDSGKQFDLIISAPPWGISPAEDYPSEDNRLEKMQIDHRLVFESCKLLSPEGRAIFFLPNQILLDQRPNGLRKLLAEKNFHIWTVVALPPQYSKLTFERGNLIEIRRGKPSSLFVGKVSVNTENDSLLRNLGNRAAGKNIEVGSLVSPEDFSNWETFEARHLFTRSSKAFGGTSVPLGEILLETILGKDGDDGGFSDIPNAVFLPRTGTSPAVTSKSEFSMKPKNYIQLVLDSTKADASYVARYFNTSIGNLSRQLASSGTIMPQIAVRSLESAPIVLPTLKEQIERVRLQRKVDEIRAELETTEREMWSVQSGAREASKVLEKYSEIDSIQKWQRRLPFPLASILQTYDATLDHHRRNDILFAFFEAVAEFLTTILLSGMRSDLDTYNKFRSEGMLAIDHSAWGRATLGFWVKSGAVLAKVVRRLNSGDEYDQSLSRNLFRFSRDWIDSLCNKEIFATLERVTELRNAWKGHGGIGDEYEIAQRHERLQAELVSILSPISRVFENVALIRPKSFEFDGEIYKVVVEQLMDAAVPFREASVEVISPMVTGSLYLHESESRIGLEILPFVRMRAGVPVPNACYFYSRLGADGAHFVSYHQVKDAEITEEDPILEALIHELSDDVDKLRNGLT